MLRQTTPESVIMSRKNPSIITVIDLLLRLTREYASRKTGAKVVSFRGSGEAKLIEYFDDGKGHSGAFTSEYTPVEMSVFEEALRQEYIENMPIHGGRSSYEFILTDHRGREKLNEYYEERRQARLVVERDREQVEAVQHIPEPNND